MLGANLGSLLYRDVPVICYYANKFPEGAYLVHMPVQYCDFYCCENGIFSDENLCYSLNAFHICFTDDFTFAQKTGFGTC